jgi:hypothetical protein
MCTAAIHPRSGETMISAAAPDWDEPAVRYLTP